MDNLFKAIQKIFTEVPRTYELVNKVLTCGLDNLWRKKAAQIAASKKGSLWLDVCTGTGQMAAYLSKFTKKNTTLVAIDFCLPMLKEIYRKKSSEKITLCLADACNLPFSENTFDLITISFAARNININKDALLKCFREFHRVLKPKGSFINLETSQPPHHFIKNILHLYAGIVIKPIGYFLSRSKKAYAYLSYTIPRFFDALELSSLMAEAGFFDIKYRYLTFGIVAIHTGLKG